ILCVRAMRSGPPLALPRLLSRANVPPLARECRIARVELRQAAQFLGRVSESKDDPILRPGRQHLLTARVVVGELLGGRLDRARTELAPDPGSVARQPLRKLAPGVGRGEP